MSEVIFDRLKPYNKLAQLPPGKDIENNSKILKKLVLANLT